MKTMTEKDIIKKTAQGVITMEEKKEPFNEEELLQFLMKEEERVAALPEKEREEYLLWRKARAEILWPGEKFIFPPWITSEQKVKKEEVQVQWRNTAGSLKTSGQN